MVDWDKEIDVKYILGAAAIIVVVIVGIGGGYIYLQQSGTNGSYGEPSDVQTSAKYMGDGEVKVEVTQLDGANEVVIKVVNTENSSSRVVGSISEVGNSKVVETQSSERIVVMEEINGVMEAHNIYTTDCPCGGNTTVRDILDE